MRGNCGRTNTIFIICSCAFLILAGIIYLTVCHPPKAIMLGNRFIDESMMEFSPDGTEVGYVITIDYALFYPEAPTRMKEAYFCWQDVNDNRGFKSVKVYSDRNRNQNGVGELLRTHFSFSPDSKYACVATMHQLYLVEIASGKVSQITYSDERVTSFRWLNSDEIRYVSTGFCWQQRIDKEPKSRKRLCSIESDGLEFWSPTGKYVVYLNESNSSSSSLDVLNVSRNDIIASIEQPDDGTLTTAWKQDGSEIFCIVRYYRMESKAYLFKLPSGQLIERSNELNKHFGKNIPRLLKPLWTNDGQYVLTNLYIWDEIGDCLIRPENWEVVDIESNLPKHVPKNKYHKPLLFQLPFSGWFGVQAWASDGSNVWKYIVDYEFKHAILLERGRVVALSPDGTLVAIRDPFRKTIEIREVAIPNKE